MALAAAAFVLSYPGIHRIALQAGVATTLAALYPLILDAMLVIAGATALTMRNAGWWARCYVWLCLLLLLAVAGTGSAVHAMGLALPRQPTRAGVAVTPWVVLLLGFGLLLAMLRYLRQARRAARREAAGADAGTGPAGGPPPNATWAGGPGTSSGDVRLPAPRGQLDALLGSRAGPAPAIAAASQAPAPAAEHSAAETLAPPAEASAEPAADPAGRHGGGGHSELATGIDADHYTPAEYGLIAEYPPPRTAEYSSYDLEAAYPADLDDAYPRPAEHDEPAARPPETGEASSYGGEYGGYGTPEQAPGESGEGGAHRKPAGDEQPTDDAAAPENGDPDASQPPGSAPVFDRVRSTPTPPDE
jgi:hypothetical protein